MKRLKYPNDIIDAVCAAVRNHMRLKGAGIEGEVVSDKALRKLQAEMGPHLEMTLDLMHSDNTAHADDHNMFDQIPGIRARLKNLAAANNSPKLVMPINGNDIMNAFGLKPGPIVKVMLDVVKDACYENPNISAKEALS
jgi:poly(A) polymerase